MPTKRTESHVDQVTKDTKKTEKGLNKKKRSRRKKNATKNDAKKHQPSNSERMIAPILLIITILISYLVVLAK